MTFQSLNEFYKQQEARVGGEGAFGPRRKFTKLPNSIIDDEKLSCQEKMVYAVLLRYGFKKGECWPSLKTLIKKSRVSRWKIFSVLKSLNHKGYIEIKKAKGVVNRYLLKI